MLNGNFCPRTMIIILFEIVMMRLWTDGRKRHAKFVCHVAFIGSDFALWQCSCPFKLPCIFHWVYGLMTKRLWGKSGTCATGIPCSRSLRKCLSIYAMLWHHMARHDLSSHHIASNQPACFICAFDITHAFMTWHHTRLHKHTYVMALHYNTR